MERSRPKSDLQALNAPRLMFRLCRSTRMKDKLPSERGEGSAVTICVHFVGLHSTNITNLRVEIMSLSPCASR
jgi:hypothetical protein